MMRQALSFIASNNIKEAEKLCQYIQGDSQDNVFVHLVFGIAAHERGDFSTAISHLEISHTINPEFGAVLLENFLNNLPTAIHYFYENSLRALHNAKINIMGTGALTHSLLATHFISQGRHEDAVFHLERARALKPDDASALQRLLLAHSLAGINALNLGSNKSAIFHFERAHTLKPDDSNSVQRLLSVHTHAGINALGTGSNKDAIFHLERAYALKPDDTASLQRLSSAYSLAGIAALNSGATKDAVSHFERAYALKPENAETLKRLLSAHIVAGAGALGQNLPDDAVAHFERAHALRPDDTETAQKLSLAYVNAGAIAFRQGMYADGAAYLERAYGIKPDDVQIFHKLVIGLQHVGTELYEEDRYHEALPYLKRAVYLHPDNADVYGYLLAALQALEDEGSAHQLFQRMLEKQQDNPIALSGLARLIQPPARKNRSKGSADRATAKPKRRVRKNIKIFIFANCQGVQLKRVLARLLESAVNADIINTRCDHGIDAKIKEHLDFVKECDVVIYQPVWEFVDGVRTYKISSALDAELPANALRIAIPYIYSSYLWPLYINKGAVVTSKSVMSLLCSDVSMDKILQDYDDGILDFEFSPRYQESMGVIQSKECVTQVRIHDYITKNIRDEYLFTSCAHPTLTVFSECARQIRNILCESNVVSLPEFNKNIYNHWPVDAIPKPMYSPIDNSSLNHFQFNWCNRDGIPYATRYYHTLLRYIRSQWVSGLGSPTFPSGSLAHIDMTPAI